MRSITALVLLVHLSCIEFLVYFFGHFLSVKTRYYTRDFRAKDHHCFFGFEL